MSNQITPPYEMGQVVYAVSMIDGYIKRYEVAHIRTDQYKKDRPITTYYDGHIEIPTPTDVESWGKRACSVFSDRKSANKAALPYKEAARQKQIVRLQEQIAYMRSELGKLQSQQEPSK